MLTNPTPDEDTEDTRNPELLERATAGSDHFPNQVESSREPSVDLEAERYQRRFKKRQELIQERKLTQPRSQFMCQIKDLLYHRLYAHGRRDRIQAIHEHWVKQGIWNKDWGYNGPYGPWKHEEPQASGESSKIQPKDEEPDSSRPLNQSLYQMRVEREHVQRLLGDTALPPDINDKMYWFVKDVWEARCLWNKKWGCLPGMSWNHEEPLEEWIKSCMGNDYIDEDGKGLKDDEKVQDNNFRLTRGIRGSWFEPIMNRQKAEYLEEQRRPYLLVTADSLNAVPGKSNPNGNDKISTVASNANGNRSPSTSQKSSKAERPSRKDASTQTSPEKKSSWSPSSPTRPSKVTKATKKRKNQALSKPLSKATEASKKRKGPAPLTAIGDSTQPGRRRSARLQEKRLACT